MHRNKKVATARPRNNAQGEAAAELTRKGTLYFQLIAILILFIHWQCDTIALNRFIHLMKDGREEIANDIVCNNLPEYEGYVDHLLEGRRLRPAALCW